ncbi:MAG TPA: alpha/beta hydrolase [Steroidobacteraceae bacterium]|jgi:pimeloyl-ACP methyl ester carboxylesterase
MHRRELLKSASAAIGATALLTADGASAERRAARGAAAGRRVGPYVETRDGTQLFYRDWGSGSPLVFLSGWGLTSDCWAYQMAPLSDSGLRCVAYDRRGHGRSSDPGRGFDYDTLADDLAAVLEALDLQNVTLVTHSMAGGEAVRYLSRSGSKRVARVALVAATLPFMTRTADNPDGIDPAVFENGRRNVIMRDFPKALRDNLRPFVVPETSQALVDWIAGLMQQCSMRALVDCNKALSATDFRPELAKLDVPTLIVHGDKDVSAPLAITGRKTAALLPNATVKIYEGAPHGLFLTHAERLNKDLQEFSAT